MLRIRARWQATSLLLLLLAIPLGAQTVRPAAAPLCFTSGSATYRLAPVDEPDYRVRIAAPGGAADVRMQLVDDAQDADFVLVDDPLPGDGTPCNGAGHVRTIALAERASAGREADVTVSLSADANADFRLYVRSARFSHADAAALLAVIWQADRTRRQTASR